MKSRMFLLLTVCLLASGCDDSTSPLSDPQKSKPDARLAGLWRERDKDGNVTYYHVGTTGNKLPRGVMGVVQVTHLNSGDIQTPGGRLLVFPTVLGDKTYLNMTDGDQQQIQKKGWKSVKSYFLLKYKVEGDKLVVWRMEEDAKRQAIKAGKIKGLIEEKKDKVNTRVVFTDTTENLARFVAQAGDGLWDTKEPLQLERVDARLARSESVVIEMSQPMRGGGGLGTMGYQATARETAFVKKITEKPVDLWSQVQMPKPSNVSEAEWAKMQAEQGKAKDRLTPAAQYRLADQAGKYVGWFGIVREQTWSEKNNATSMLIEHKYFDGMTDLHIQVVSLYGAGDFRVALPGRVANIPKLSLVAVYGKVSKKAAGMAQIDPEYVRVWDWGLFTFMDYGVDKSNPTWVKLRKVEGKDAYSPRPTRQFYEERLGKR